MIGLPPSQKKIGNIHHWLADDQPDQVKPQHWQEEDQGQQDHRAVRTNAIVKFSPPLGQKIADDLFAVQRCQGDQIE